MLLRAEQDTPYARPASRSRALGALLVVAVSLALSACGGSSKSSDDAASLLKQTFSGKHVVNSGNLNFTLTVNPSGSSTLTTPITVSFGGPFQSLGAGKLPKSNFSVSLRAQGKAVTIGILSTGTTGYVTFDGASYQLPASTFQRLESSFAQLASSPSSGSGSSALSKVGIHPLDWLTKPSVIGDDSVAGANTTHIHAGVNVASLLVDVNTVLQKASSLGIAKSSSATGGGISASTRTRVASEVQNPTFDVWTGNSDKSVRKLALSLTLPVSGQTSTALGGLRSAAIGLTIQYANLNQPQTISPPSNVRPFSEFTTKVRSFLSALRSGLGQSSSSATQTAPSATDTAPTATQTAPTATTSTTPSSATTTPAPGSTDPKLRRYSECLASAHADIAKMQRCATLING